MYMYLLIYGLCLRAVCNQEQVLMARVRNIGLLKIYVMKGIVMNIHYSAWFYSDMPIAECLT